jgi:2-keto-3-deoxy-L-rhamnonate aldolase RhmA
MAEALVTGPQLRNPLAETLAAGRLGLALLVQKVQSVDIALAARSCGFDAVNIDLEHSVIPEAAAAQICVTALQCGVTPLVRVPSHDGHHAGRMLDAGACGIVAPHVTSADEARAIVQACRFAPLGRRSVAGSWPHLGYRSWPADAVRRVLDAATTVVVMLETPEAIANADAIAAVPGVDILHVGSTDLCEAMGMPGRFADPALARCFDQVVAACRRHGKVAGAGGLAGTPEVMRTMVRLGVRFVTAGIEWDFLMSAARQRAALLRELPLE